MKLALTTALAIAFAAASFPACPQTYQWKDAAGRTVISDTPPPPGVKGSRAIGTNVPTVSTEKVEEKDPKAPKTLADKDMDFKKRQQEAKEKADKKAKDEAAAKEKQEHCERTRRQMATLESNQRLATTDENGERQYMDAARREQEMERINKALSDCN